MSCRVLKRQVEEEVLNEIVRLARLRDAGAVHGVYLPTAKNGMVRDHYAQLGFTIVEDREECPASRSISDRIPCAGPIFESTNNPMTQTEVLNRLQPIFDDLFMEKVELTPELSANDVEEWDSILQISLSMEVERQFGIRFRVGEVESTTTVGEFASLIARHAAANGTAPGQR
jgi:acyl carrier protein